MALETDKIKGAVRTDFILSAEIIAITLGTVAAAPFATQVAVLAGIALVMTVGRLRPGGRHRQARRRRPVAEPARRRAARRRSARGILRAAPWLMKGLSIAGTAAMFLVGGGILVHGIPPLHHAVQALGAGARRRWPRPLLPTLADALVGIVAGALVLAGVTLFQRLRGRPA